MKSIVVLVFMAMLCAGCRSSSSVADPFLGRQTIPPPGTATPPPGQPYYGAPPTVSPGAQIAPPTGGTLPATTTPMNFAPTPAGGNGFSSFSPNVSPVSPSPASGSAPNSFGRPAFTPVSSPVKPNYAPPGGPAYSPAAGINPTAMNTAQAGVPKPLDVDRIIGPASQQSATQPTPAVMQAAQWQPSGTSTKTSAVTPASYNATSGQSPIRVIEPTADARRAPKAPELSELPPASANQLQPIAAPIVRPPAANSAAPTPRSGNVASPRIGNYGYDPQYRWLKGKLEYAQSTRSWRLRYIPAEEAGDQFGGSVKLADATKLNGFHNGDLVSVQGSVGNAVADQGSFAPLYNIERIQKQ